MSDVAVSASGLSKQYRIGAVRRPPDTLGEALGTATRRLIQRGLRAARSNRTQQETFWALRDVSFTLRQGEVLGIIGANGAGKSTLLKILSRITEPTLGTADVYGRVASLLEVGTGFHTELSGRENIYLNGAIMGMRRAEISRKFDEIVAFSEVGQFIDTPVKHYSSGMYLRLAFAVAAHLEPEILIVDEVLAVGDAGFQKKCLGRMSTVAEEGRTVLFVSHNMTAVRSLCSRAVRLDHGRLVDDGAPAAIVGNYISDTVTATPVVEWTSVDTAPGNEYVRIRRAEARSSNADGRITIRTPFDITLEYWVLRPGLHLNLSLHVYNEEGVLVFNTTTTQEPQWHGRPFPEGLFRSSCAVPGDLMNDGFHRVVLLVVRDEGTVVYRHADVITFQVENQVQHTVGWQGRWPGAVRPQLPWKTELVEPAHPTTSMARKGP